MFDKKVAECAEGAHAYTRCVVEMGDSTAFDGVGTCAAGDVCEVCGHVDAASLEYRFLRAEGSLIRCAEPADYGRELPVVALASGETRAELVTACG